MLLHICSLKNSKGISNHFGNDNILCQPKLVEYQFVANDINNYISSIISKNLMFQDSQM